MFEEVNSVVSTLRLFLVPSISAIVLLIPIAGVFLYGLIVYRWYTRNQEDVHAFFLGHSYRKKEYSVDTLEKLV